MEMTANFWNPSASGGGDWRSTLLARAPQVVTFVLALALAAQLAFIVVGHDAAAAVRRRRHRSPPLPAAAAARHRRTGQRTSVRQCGRAGQRRCRQRAAVQHAAGAGGRPGDRRSQGRHGDHRRERARPRRSSPSVSRCPAARSCTRCTATAPSSIAAARSNRCILPRQTGGRHGAAAAAARGRAATATRPWSNACASWSATIPGVISQVMRPQPVFAGGEMKGFRVYPGANRQAFARLGLRAGDMVTAINGTPLNDKDRAQEIFGTLGSSTDARVTITRNGRQQELVFNIAQITAEAERLGARWRWQYPDDQRTRPPGRVDRKRITRCTAVLNSMTRHPFRAIALLAVLVAFTATGIVGAQNTGQATTASASRRASRTRRSARSSRPSRRPPARPSFPTRACARRSRCCRRRR